MNTDILKTAEKKIQYIVSGRMAFLDHGTREELVQDALFIFAKRNKFDVVAEHFCKLVVREVLRNARILKYKISSEVVETENGVEKKEVFAGRTKKQQVKDESETLNIDDCYNVADQDTDVKAKRRLFEAVPNNASKLMKDVIAKICGGAEQDDVAAAYHMTWKQLATKLSNEAGNDHAAAEVGQFSFGF